MKIKQLAVSVTILFLSAFFITCGSAPAPARTMSAAAASTALSTALPTGAPDSGTPISAGAEELSLFEAVEQSAERIATELPAGSRVAILSFDTDSPHLSVFIMEELAGALFDRGIEIADRQNLDIIYRELNFQMGGEVSDSTVLSIGKFLGADMIITGQMRPLGSTYRFTANAIHVEKATRASIPRLTVRNDRETQNIIAALNQQTGTGGTVQSERAAAETRVNEVRAAMDKITASSSAPEAQAVAAFAAEALAAAQARAEEARIAEVRAAEQARLAEVRAAEQARIAAEHAAEQARASAIARIPVPADISVDAGITSVALSWSAVTNSTSYKIYRSTASGGPFNQIASTSVPNFTDNGLNQRTTYHYRITATIDGLEGRQTNTIYATTLSLTAGTMVPGNSLTEKLAWLDRNADSHNTYVVEVNSDESISPYTFTYRGAINITIALRGDHVNRIIRLRSHGRMFTIPRDVTLILENNITLHGHDGNNGAMVYLNGGNLIMNSGASVTGNTSSEGGGVYISGGTFTMNGGIITNNKANNGGGVYNRGTFNMIGGTISGNSTNRNDGRGGGVYLGYGTFNMRGGIITGNTANNYGGGVVISYGTFTKTGGIITGYNTDQTNGNAVRDADGNILARRGHAVYVNENLRKETTSGSGDNLSNSDRNRWD